MWYEIYQNKIISTYLQLEIASSWRNLHNYRFSKKSPLWFPIWSNLNNMQFSNKWKAPFDKWNTSSSNNFLVTLFFEDFLSVTFLWCLCRVKRQRDTCKFGPKIVKHGEIYEFGTDCDCFNGNFKCNKYSRIRHVIFTLNPSWVKNMQRIRK